MFLFVLWSLTSSDRGPRGESEAPRLGHGEGAMAGLQHQHGYRVVKQMLEVGRHCCLFLSPFTVILWDVWMGVVEAGRS